MRTIIILLVSVLGAAQGHCDQPQSAEARKFEQFWLKDHRKYFGRKLTGVLLTASAKVEGDKVALRWTISYDGHRPPLIILKPMPPEKHLRSTYVFAVLRRGEEGVFLPLHDELRLREGQRLSQPARDDFLTIAEGQNAQGTIAVPLQTLKNRLLAKQLAQPDQLPSELYIGLAHAPWARGAEYGFDAWTVDPGDLRSMPQRVIIENWP